MIAKEEFWNKVSELLKMQKALDERILEEKGLDLSKFELFELTRTALIVEVSEATNVAEFFKHWKDTRGNKADEGKTHEETLKEEFSDALHFLLSMINQTMKGNPLNYDEKEQVDFLLESPSHNTQYIGVKYALNFDKKGRTILFKNLVSDIAISQSGFRIAWFSILIKFFIYAHSCGVTFGDLYDAYMIKNKVNYERLESGY